MTVPKSNFPLLTDDSGHRVPPGSGFRVTVLGRAGSFPAPGEPTTGLLLSTDTTHVLVDCGAGVVANMLYVLSPELLDAVVLTHLHPDHVSDLTVLTHLVRFFVWPRSRSAATEPQPLPLYLPVHPVDRMLSLPMDEAFERRFYHDRHRMTVGDLDFTFRETSHAVHCLALRAENGGGSLVFTADTGPSANVTQLAQGASLLISELSAPDSMADRSAQVGHLTPQWAAQLAVDAGVDRALMTHFVMGYDADKLVLQTNQAARSMAQSLGRDAPIIEPAGLLQTYPVSRAE